MNSKELRTQEFIIHTGYSNVKMPITKINGFFLECPWVNNIIPKEKVRQVYVQRVNSSFLLYKPIRRYCGYLEGCVFEMIYLLDEKGKIIKFTKPVFKKEHVFWGKKIHVGNIDIEAKVTGENVGTLQSKFIEMISVLDKVKYMLSYCSYTQAIILYKIPGNVLLSQWIEEEAERERNNFKKELEAMG